MEQACTEADAAEMLAKSRLFQLMVDTAAVTHIDVEQATAKPIHG
jgi:hypothetical protein